MYRADAYISSADYKFKRTSPKVDRQPDREDHAMSVLLNAQRQTIDGFGSALTESAASCICALPEEKRQALLDEIYLRAGAAFSMCRLHIGSCDFSLGEYAYTEPDDRDMRTFSFAREDKYVAPVLMEALKRRGDMTLLASPWSAPGWMKTNGDVRHGGNLREDWRREWGEYVARYIEAWRERGANIAAITVQNEPHASQPWESCVYNAQQEAELVTEILTTKEYPRTIHTTDRATNLNLMIALNAYTLCSGVICEELNGPEYVAVPFIDDDENRNSVMEIGYLTKKGMALNEMGRHYVQEIKAYLSAHTSA